MNTNSPTEEQKRTLQLKEHRRKYWQQYYMKNREKIIQRSNERQKRWYANSTEHASNYQKAYYKQRADELRAERMEYYWNVEKERPTKPNKPKKPKKFEPTLVKYELNVTLTFD